MRVSEKIKLKKVLTPLGFLSCLILAFLVVSPANAGTWSITIASGVAALGALLIENVLGPILLLLVDILISIASYNDFINSAAVANGWVIVRDIANMFFIIVLLIVAFGTILGQEQYHYKKLLPRLLLMALFVNFSRTLVGLLIDAAQVVMITFVNGFHAAAGGNFVNALGINKIMTIDQAFAERQAAEGVGIDQLQIAGAVTLGVIFLLVSIVVILVMLAVLVFRVVMLWALTVISPVAWLASAVPQGQKYYADWWKQFSNQLLLGPILAFFLWLALAVAGAGQISQEFTASAAGGEAAAMSASISEIGMKENMFSYIIAIAMLLAGLQLAQELGSSFAGSGLSAIKSGARRAVRTGVGAAKWTGKNLDMLQGGLTGIQLAKVPERFKAGLAERRAKRELQIKERGAAVAGVARKIPLVGAAFGIPYAALSNPEGFAKTFMSRGMVARSRQALLGSWVDKKFIKGTADEKLKKAQDLREEVKVEEQGFNAQKTDFESADKNLDSLYKKEKELKSSTKDLQGFLLSEKSEERYNLALKTGLIDPSVGFNKFSAMSAKEVKSLEKKAKDKYADNTDELGSLPTKIQEAQRDLSTKRQSFLAAETAFAAGAPERERKTKEAEVLEQNAREWEGYYLAGESSADRDLEQARFKQETEAYKKLDATRSTEELIGDFQRALAQGDKALVSLIAKEVSKRGDAEDLFKTFGVHETGQQGLKRFTEEVLEDKGGLDETYAKKTAMRMADNQVKDNQWHYKGVLKADPITNEVDWAKKPEEMAGAAASALKEKNLRNILETGIAPGSLVEKKADGTTSLSPQGLAVIERINSEPEAFGKLVEQGRVGTEILRTLSQQLGQLKSLESKGLMESRTIKIIEERAKILPMPGASSKDRAEALARAL